MKVVLDTNILVSGLLWRGAPYRCLLAIRAGLAEMVLSPPIVDELRRVLVTKFHHTAVEADQAVMFVRESATLVEIPGDLRKPLRSRGRRTSCPEIVISWLWVGMLALP